MINPNSLSVPHPAWREHQYESYCTVRDSDNRHFILESPTGSGKSAVATALGHDTPVLILAATLGLLEQYQREYNFTIIKGRQEYPCAHPDKIAEWRQDFGTTPTAFDCHFSPMHKCPFAVDCSYLAAKQRAIHAQRTACTYKYAGLARWPRERKGILVCDEGHRAAEEILAFGEFRVTSTHVRRYGVPNAIRFFPVTIRATMNQQLRGKLDDYLSALLRNTSKFRGPQSPKAVRGWRFHLRVKRLLEEELGMTDNWFLEAGPAAIKTLKGGQPGLILRPLDARSVAGRLWGNKQKILLMSATIGDPDPLAHALGIDDFDWRTTPHLIPVDKRPVHIVFRERMTKRNLDTRPGLYKAQATAISHFVLKQIPPEWRGIILTTSYKKIARLRENLQLGGRLWTAPNGAKGVTGRIEAFLKDPRQGIICVDTVQGWGHGLDLRGDLGRFVVIAGVPFHVPNDPFNRARLKIPGTLKYLRWIAYNAVPQMAGRVTRGVKDGNGEYYLNMAAIADGSALSPLALKHYSGWFKEAFGD